jgi:Zn-dependent protease with chaperone function
VLPHLIREDAWDAACSARYHTLTGHREIAAQASDRFNRNAKGTRDIWAFARDRLRESKEPPVAARADRLAVDKAPESPKPSQRLGPLSFLEIAALSRVGGLIVLFVVGAILSRAASRAAEELPQDADGSARGLGATVRQAYGLVLWLSCAYYYVSLPLLALVTLLIGGGIVYAMIVAGRIPVRLLLLVVIVTLATLWAILKSLFVRVADDDPGESLDLRPHPRLRVLLREVAQRIDTRSVDTVYLTPGTEIAVQERGGLRRQLSGDAERCLVLGIGVLDGLRLRPFRAILAHEYGHFSNRDTAGGGFALAGRRSLLSMAGSLASSGAAKWYNPAWLFLNVFYRAFLRISQGASRLQEVLADRWAAFTYGSKAFEEGLRHVIERSVRFDERFRTGLLALAVKREVANLYAPQPADPSTEPEIQRAIRESLSQRPSPYDSHPSPAERARWVRALHAQGTVVALDDEEEAWSLFADRARIEEEMMRSVRQAAHAMVSAAAADE